MGTGSKPSANRHTGNIIHTMASEMVYTRRNAMVHWGEGVKGENWAVPSIAATIPFSPNLRGVEIIDETKQTHSSHISKKILLIREQEQKLGYRPTDDDPGKILANFLPYAESQLKDNTSIKYGVFDTHLKKHFSEIKIAFSFKGIPVETNKIIGYAAVGTFIKDQGWDGIRVFFKNTNGNICSFQRMGILAVQLIKQKTSYEVNKKPRLNG